MEQSRKDHIEFQGQVRRPVSEYICYMSLVYSAPDKRVFDTVSQRYDTLIWPDMSSLWSSLWKIRYSDLRIEFIILSCHVQYHFDLLNCLSFKCTFLILQLSARYVAYTYYSDKRVNLEVKLEMGFINSCFGREFRTCKLYKVNFRRSTIQVELKIKFYLYLYVVCTFCYKCIFYICIYLYMHIMCIFMSFLFL